jgi:aspartyl-tRNA(Asn)/glutamyl-tRNA(Gln) amidotransferase subunit C
MPLSPDEARRVATLARIELDHTETTELLAQLNGILVLVGELQAADTGGVEPMAHPVAHPAPPGDAPGAGAALRLREDRVTETDRRTLYQSVSPQVDQGLYLVPKVIE